MVLKWVPQSNPPGFPGKTVISLLALVGDVLIVEYLVLLLCFR